MFSGMNIHKSQLFWCELKRGTIGFDTLPDVGDFSGISWDFFWEVSEMTFWKI